MEVRAAALAVCLAFAAGACGSDDRDELVACLTDRGGTPVRSAQQVASLDWQRGDDGGGASLDHLSYAVVLMPAKARGEQALVVIDAGLQGDDLARGVWEDPGRFRDVVLMPPRASATTFRPIEDCVDEAAPGELFP